MSFTNINKKADTFNLVTVDIELLEPEFYENFPTESKELIDCFTGDKPQFYVEALCKKIMSHQALEKEHGEKQHRQNLSVCYELLGNARGDLVRLKNGVEKLKADLQSVNERLNELEALENALSQKWKKPILGGM